MSTDIYVDTFLDSYDNVDGVTVQMFSEFVGITADQNDDPNLKRNLDSAGSMIDAFLGVRKSKVPVPVYMSVHLKVAQQLYFADTKDTSTSGQYGQDGTFVTVRPKDPMHYAYPILRKFVGWF
ncbi:hypothetical protein QM797_10150 [Rhodococcus sp. IEGM 1381]|uniref:hypothetical protein n=1 Tax=Rhodococcus sp. IEGM 1381 TaxID=3047085 RepID=UPI0024B6AF26|nr:hypothetical protein [Rhodococcus sp. IEGM 1381]MDI9895087.1 hypothetical protein [Rhodococcus sp. IEGM 1381]